MYCYILKVQRCTLAQTLGKTNSPTSIWLRHVRYSVQSIQLRNILLTILVKKLNEPKNYASSFHVAAIKPSIALLWDSLPDFQSV